MAIPASTLPGLSRLHTRAQAALDRCVETPDVDFKESVGWEAIKGKIVRTVMGMANIRDGGIIVVGLSEKGQEWDPVGLPPEILETYKPDVILDAVNEFASPGFQVEIATFSLSDGKVFLVIQVPEFQEIPIICRKDGKLNKDDFFQGEIYTRPLGGRARTEKLRSSDELRAILELAAEKKARRFAERAKRVGYVPSLSDDDLFKKERGDL
jgi:predicted HTH transcriptional regulator